jgi:hypothetical protein
MNRDLSDHDSARLRRIIRGEQEHWRGDDHSSDATTRVHNLRGTGYRDPPDGYRTFKAWWEYKKGRRFENCSCCGRAITESGDGSHVQKVDGGDEWYIVPLCDDCNLSKQPPMEFDVKTDDLEPLNP